MYAIVPAYNEAPSVGGVVEALSAAKVFDEVIVVDDSSTDGTADAAAAAGATVLRTPRNLGKGGAMLYAYHSALELDGPVADDRVAFFDADLLDLRVDHLHRMARASELGYDQVAGLQEKGDARNVLQVFYSPLITGQRILRRWVLDALPESCWAGYSIETAFNDAVERGGGKTVLVQLDGVSFRKKIDKVGWLDGLRGYWKMTREIARTRAALQRSEGMSCAL